MNALNRDSIIDEALRLIDEEGLPSLSMRRLGARLGVEAMSLYHHVESKDAILDAIVDRVIGEIPLPEPGSEWRESLAEVLRSQRAALGGHPHVLSLVLSRPKTGPKALAFMEHVVAVLRTAGFDVAHSHATFHLLQAVAVGFLAQELNDPGHEAAAAMDTGALVERLTESGLPHLAELMANPAPGYDADFQYGIEVVLRGLDPEA